MKYKSIKILLVLTVCNLNLIAQNTIGNTFTNSEKIFDGLTLFTKNLDTYLIDNCGRIINKWTSEYNPGNAVYLLEDGSLLRACKLNNTDIVFGGTGGRIEKYNWEGDLIWFYNYSSENFLQHHDIYPMPNGNILMLAVSVMSSNEAINLGRNPTNIVEERLYNEQILELKPLENNNVEVVWEWNVNEHLIQDFDSTKLNFGNVELNPQLLDINFLGTSNGRANWLHFNSIQYHEDLDQIVISSRLLSEIYIIDHSTTKEEVKTHEGGKYGKGGDFIYRWGNQAAYQKGDGTNQKLFSQHYPYIIPKNLKNEGDIIVFNNGNNRTPSYSEVLIFSPPRETDGNYILNNSTSTYLPEDSLYTYGEPDGDTTFFSRFLSSAQMLPNNNILINSGADGNMFEIDENNEIVWRYIVPIGSSGVLTQGEGHTDTGNAIFRANKYSRTFIGFTGKDLTPKDPIENNSNLDNCETLAINNYTQNITSIYPNPTEGTINISTLEKIKSIHIYSSVGKLVMFSKNNKSINLNGVSKGIYYVRIHTKNGKIINKKILKK